MASRKKTDSSPSRPTAKKAISTSAMAPPDRRDSAASTEPCSSLLMERAAFFIQKIMEVSTPTATRATAPSKNSCCFCGNSASAAFMAMPSARQMAVARTTPAHTAGMKRERPVCWR